MAHHKFVLKLLKTTVFGKKAFGKSKESSKDKCATVKEKGGNEEQYVWKGHSHKILASLSYLQCEIQFMKKSLLPS